MKNRCVQVSKNDPRLISIFKPLITKYASLKE